MALIKCPECGKEISDRSKVCIHCGFPISELEDSKTEVSETEEENAAEQNTVPADQIPADGGETKVSDNEQDTPSVTGNISKVDNSASATAQKKKAPSKKLIILGVVIAAVILVAFKFLYKSEFERVKDEVVQIAGSVTSGKNYFTVDTYPDYYEGMDASVVAILAPTTQENALKGIKHANEALGFNGSLYSKMLETSAIMGRQSEENKKYRVTWTYHPDDGLEVTYEKK